MSYVFSYSLISPTPEEVAAWSVSEFGIPEALPYATIGLTTGDIPDTGPALVFGADAVMQDLSSMLSTWLSEWFLDENVGMPYVQTIFKKGCKATTIAYLFRKAIMLHPGVTSIKKCEVDIDNGNRSATVTFEVVLNDGTIGIASYSPFVIGEGT